MLTKQELSLNELMVFSSELRRAEKSAAIAYLMLLGGHLGLHRFYLKKKGTLSFSFFCSSVHSSFISC